MYQITHIYYTMYYGKRPKCGRQDEASRGLNTPFTTFAPNGRIGN
jgi:hypothetical protein